MKSLKIKKVAKRDEISSVYGRNGIKTTNLATKNVTKISFNNLERTAYINSISIPIASQKLK